ncbi:MAG: ABC transporter permease [Bifidobacteriaceae bacterium]|jgi:putative ABC transport system permease protein|nr:ABC transporter permease [Bifidobacteriaceae bacterium]
MYLAWKELRYSKLRYSLVIGIMALVAYVVFMLSGLANGLSNGHKKAVVDWEASSIVLSSDSNKVASASVLKRSDIDRVDASQKAGVGLFSAAIHPVSHPSGSSTTNISIFGTSASSFVVPKVTQGRLYERANEIVVSENLLAKGYKVGEHIKLGSDTTTFTIVGVTPATTYAVVPVAYLNLDAYTSLKYGSQPFASASDKPISLIAVKGKSVTDLTISTSKSDTKLTALSMDTFVENLPGYSAEKLTLSTMIYFLFVVVAAIIGIFMYVITLQKTSIFGVLKAQGVTTGYLVKSVMSQSLIVGIIGVGAAFLLGYLTSLGLPSAMPFTVDITQWILYAAILIAVSVVGGLFSIRTVTKVDPISAIGGE